MTRAATLDPTVANEWALWMPAGLLALALHAGGVLWVLPRLPDAAEEQRETEITMEIMDLTGGQIAKSPSADAIQSADIADTARADRVSEAETEAKTVTASESESLAASDAESLTASEAESLSARDDATVADVADKPELAQLTQTDDSAETPEKDRLIGQDLNAQTPETAPAAQADRAPEAQRITGQATAANPVQIGTPQRITGTLAPTSTPATTVATATASASAPVRALPGTTPQPTARAPSVNVAPSRVASATTVTGVSPTAPVSQTAGVSQPSATTAPRIARPEPSSPTALRPTPVSPPVTANTSERIVAQVVPERPLAPPTVATIAAVPEQAPAQVTEEASTSTPSAPPPGSEIDPLAWARYITVLDHVRNDPTDGCFAALPRLNPDTGRVALEAFGSSFQQLDGYLARLKNDTGVVTDAIVRPVIPAQCPGLDFLRSSKRYPEFGLELDLPGRTIASGSRLEGLLLNTDNQFLHLVVIDDEGFVQALDLFLRRGDSRASFSIPMTLKESSFDDQQLLMALGAPSALNTIGEFSGASAEVFFAALTKEVTERGFAIDASMVSFAVK